MHLDGLHSKPRTSRQYQRIFVLTALQVTQNNACLANNLEVLAKSQSQASDVMIQSRNAWSDLVLSSKSYTGIYISSRYHICHDLGANNNFRWYRVTVWKIFIYTGVNRSGKGLFFYFFIQPRKYIRLQKPKNRANSARHVAAPQIGTQINTMEGSASKEQ